MPELAHNPFATRICEVFSADGTGDMGFEDFLDMFSVFSENATRDVKASYAFRIYDFDCDGYLNERDLQETLARLTGRVPTDPDSGLAPSVATEVIKKVFAEADLDGDKRLSYVEFENIISRSPDFLNTFRIRF